jgi:hypothetical protein
LLLSLVGNGFFIIDPSLVLLKKAKGAGALTTAKPSSVPQLRINPPSPPSPSYSVGAPTTRRRTD